MRLEQCPHRFIRVVRQDEKRPSQHYHQIITNFGPPKEVARVKPQLEGPPPLPSVAREASAGVVHETQDRP